MVLQDSVWLHVTKIKANESRHSPSVAAISGLTTLFQTSHLLFWLGIIGEYYGKSTISDGCIDGFDDGNNDSLLLGAVLSTYDGCVPGNIKDTIVGYWDG